MTKKVFLEKLEKRLSILNAEEKKGIIDEYRDIIEEKIKNGMKEEEAVADFGDFDEFVSEILSAYKIDPNMGSEKSHAKAQDFLETGEELIREGAKKLSDATEKIVSNIKENNEEITIELIFELLLKGLCALIIMGFLTLPFLLFSHIGSSILGFVMFPLDKILQFIWKIIVSLFYLATCAFLIVTMFKGYIKKPIEGKDKKKEGKKESTKKEERKGETVKKDVVSPSKEKKKEIKKDSSSISSLLTILLKIFIIFFFIFPIWVLILCAFLFLAILCYFLFKGIGVLGLIICTLSAISFLFLLSHVLYYGIFEGAKVHLYPFVITLLFALVGAIMTFDYFTSFDYIDTAPSSHVEKMVYTTDLIKPISLDQDFTLVIDNTVEDGKAIVEVSYYDEYVDIEKIEGTDLDKKDIYVYTHWYSRSSKNVYGLVLDNLKQKKIYDYDKLDTVSIVVKVNANMQSLVLKD